MFFLDLEIPLDFLISSFLVVYECTILGYRVQGLKPCSSCFLMLCRLITSLLSSILSEFETDLIKIECLSGFPADW